ncbi:glycosyltransferase family 2 protein [Microbacterium terricola]|uniref:Glycosyltransferase 2-like domain-containing protein n=1 Tax=Microbacterium terricola TaxID=344163 RepID=A0ABM8DV55_9MICO|nr:glycosyltransferase family A protein [Microbacterium terricola]UYK41640.1 glycosyltransferase family 2 protein [Microbacterium terricola]BDV29513.1 hypothetical protein Microterr_01730 [Microbacterium terricola]
MPVHNAARYVGAAIDSVLADMPHDAELVIVDDGSTDGSAVIVRAAAERDDRITVIRNETPTGVSRALNTAVRHGDCPAFVAVAEHDDLVLAGRFSAQLAALRGEPALGAVSGEGRYLGPSGRIAGRVSVGPRSKAEFDELRSAGREILIPHPAIMYRRDAVIAAGLYDAAFDAAQDLEIVNRLVYAAGWEVRTIAQPHVLYRIHDSSMSFSHISRQRLMTRYIVYRNRAQLDGEAFVSFAEWQEANQPDRRTRWRWYRKDTGALRYRQAGLAWLNRRPVAFAGNIVAASVLHPRWVLMKLRVARGR